MATVTVPPESSNDAVRSFPIDVPKVSSGSFLKIASRLKKKLTKGQYAILIESSASSYPPTLVSVTGVEKEDWSDTVVIPVTDATGKQKKQEKASVFKTEVMQEWIELTIAFDATSASAPGPANISFSLYQVNEGRNTTIVTTFNQPVEIVVPETYPTVVSRRDSVPSGYTDNIVLFERIKRAGDDLRFQAYAESVDRLLCKGTADSTYKTRAETELKNNFTGEDAYQVLKAATEAYVLWKGTLKSDDYDALGLNQSVRNQAARQGSIPIPSNPVNDYKDNYLIDKKNLPYLALVYNRLGDTRLKDQVFPRYNRDGRTFAKPTQEGDETVTECVGILKDSLEQPLMIELIWSYWHEQAMLAQTMYAIRNRIQNVSETPGPDPLANCEIGHMRSVTKILWPYIQAEPFRLTVSRRNFEYEHQYGLSLQGRALRRLQPAERRLKLLEAFHNLIYVSIVYHKEDDDTNRKADAFPVLHALKEVHFLLSEGAHNQFGDLPSTARVEMLMEQWLLARPEFQKFLPTRDSVAYPESWMGTVDAMKAAQGWNTTSVIYFNDLARFSEMLMLSIRFDRWSEETNRDAAATWAKFFRSEIQGYNHAYRIVTGIDIPMAGAGKFSADLRTDPSVLIQQRWAEQRRIGTARRSAPRVVPSPTAGAWATPRLPSKS